MPLHPSGSARRVLEFRGPAPKAFCPPAGRTDGAGRPLKPAAQVASSTTNPAHTDTDMPSVDREDGTHPAKVAYRRANGAIAASILGSRP